MDYMIILELSTKPWQQIWTDTRPQKKSGQALDYKDIGIMDGKSNQI